MIIPTASAPRRLRAPSAAATPDAVVPDGRPTPPDQARKLRVTAESGRTGPPVVKIESDSADVFRDMGGSKVDEFNDFILRDTLATAWFPPGKDDRAVERRIRAAVAAVTAFKPTDEIEGMLAAQAVALHFGAMECFRRAMIAEQPGEFQSKLRKDGANLARGMTEMLDALDRKRGKGPRQIVRVERVVVQDGGQAIVGAVATGAGVPGRGEG